MSSVGLFLADFEEGKRQGRYVDAELQNLPFADGDFDIALCSHFLFLYSEQFSEDFHVTAIQEMCRVAEEVRVFPLLALGGILRVDFGRKAPVYDQLRGAILAGDQATI